MMSSLEKEDLEQKLTIQIAPSLLIARSNLDPTYCDSFQRLAYYTYESEKRTEWLEGFAHEARMIARAVVEEIGG